MKRRARNKKQRNQRPSSSNPSARPSRQSESSLPQPPENLLDLDKLPVNSRAQALRQAAMLQRQRQHGNTYVKQMMARNGYHTRKQALPHVQRVSDRNAGVRPPSAEQLILSQSPNLLEALSPEHVAQIQSVLANRSRNKEIDERIDEVEQRARREFRGLHSPTEIVSSYARQIERFEGRRPQRVSEELTVLGHRLLDINSFLKLPEHNALAEGRFRRQLLDEFSREPVVLKVQPGHAPNPLLKLFWLPPRGEQYLELPHARGKVYFEHLLQLDPIKTGYRAEVKYGPEFQALKQYNADLDSGLKDAKRHHQTLVEMRKEQWIVHHLSHWSRFERATYPSMSIWKETEDALHEGYILLLEGKIEQAFLRLSRAEETLHHTALQVDQWEVSNLKGAGRMVQVLEYTKVAGKIAAAIASGQAGYGLAAIAGISGGYSMAQETGQQVSEMSHGLREGVDAGKIAKTGAVDALTSFVGGAASKDLSRMFIAKLGLSQGWQTYMAEFMGGVGSAPVSVATQVVAERVLSGKEVPNPSEFRDMIIDEVIQGGIADLFITAIVSKYGVRPNVGPGVRPHTGVAPDVDVGGRARVPDQEIAPSGRGIAESVPGRKMHLEDVEVEPHAVAVKPTVGGHKVKVLKDGRLTHCSDCGLLHVDYAAELKMRPDLQRKLYEIEAIENVDMKASQASELVAQLEQVRKIRIESLPQYAPSEAPLISGHKTVDDILSNDRSQFTMADVQQAYETYKASVVDPSPPEVWIRMTRGESRARLQELLGSNFPTGRRGQHIDRPSLPKGKGTERLPRKPGRFSVIPHPLRRDLSLPQSKLMSDVADGKLTPQEAGIEYQNLVAADLRAIELQELVRRKGRRMDIGPLNEVTLEGMEGPLSSNKLDQLWLDLVDNKQVILNVPRLSKKATDQLRRLGAQAEDAIGEKVYILVRETVP